MDREGFFLSKLAQTPEFLPTAHLPEDRSYPRLRAMSLSRHGQSRRDIQVRGGAALGDGETEAEGAHQVSSRPRPPTPRTVLFPLPGGT